MSGRIKIADRDWTLDPGPWNVTNVQFSGAIPGGHGSASFDVPVSNGYLAPYHTLKEGQWIVIYGDDGSELYEGEIFAVAPSVDATGGAAKLSITCGGLISVAGKRADLSATWVHRGTDDWAAFPASGIDSFGGIYLNAGVVEMRVAAGVSATIALAPYMRVAFVLDSLLSDDTVSFVSCDASWDTRTNVSNTWQWDIWGDTSLATAGTRNLGLYSNSSGTAVPLTFTPAAGTKCIMVRLLCTYGAAASTWPQFVSFPRMEVYGQGRTTKPRLDEVMVGLATRTGLATSSLSAPVGAMLDDIHVGNGLAKVTAAGALTTVAGLYAQPFEWGFWDNRTFVCRPQPNLPALPAQVVLVGGDNPGLVSWDVAEADEDVPDYACVLFGNKDSAAVPQGYPRRMYRPTTPPDNADLKIELVDYSQYILSDVSAAALGDQIASRVPSVIPATAVFDAHPQLAKNGAFPGNNSDPTSAYTELGAGAAGTLSGFAYTTASGWEGTNSPADPTCLVGDGVDDYVSWGDLAVCHFGSGAFSTSCWFNLGKVGPSPLPLIGKVGAGTAFQGWGLYVTGDGHIEGYVAQDVGAGSYRRQTGATTILAGTWHHAVMTYAGSGGDIVLYLDGIAETLTAAGAVGAYVTTNAANLELFKTA